MLQHLMISFPSGRLQEVKNKRKFQTSGSKSSRGRRGEVVATGGSTVVLKRTAVRFPATSSHMCCVNLALEGVLCTHFGSKEQTA